MKGKTNAQTGWNDILGTRQSHRPWPSKENQRQLKIRMRQILDTTTTKKSSRNTPEHCIVVDSFIRVSLGFVLSIEYFRLF